MRLTILIFVVIISLFIACKSKNRISYTKTHNTTIRIPENTLIDLIITGIDSTSVDLYEIVRFYFQKPTNIGIILKEKSSPENYIVGQVFKLKLCDIGIYGVLYSERYTIYRGNVPLIYGKQEGL